MFFVSIQISLKLVPKGPIFKDIFVNEIFCVPIQISLTVVHKGPFDNKSVLEQAMAWRRTGNKPLPEPVLTQLTAIMVAFQKKWPLMRGIISMICKEWCMEMEL